MDRHDVEIALGSAFDLARVKTLGENGGFWSPEDQGERCRLRRLRRGGHIRLEANKPQAVIAALDLNVGPTKGVKPALVIRSGIRALLWQVCAQPLADAKALF